jgi:fido (protein-threonine AMPylation protein)
MPGGPSQSLWEYEGIVPDWNARLTTRTAKILKELRRNPLSSLFIARDTRKTHEKLFEGLTPANLPQLAGHYRGEGDPVLKTCTVTFDGIKGAEPHLVEATMTTLREGIEKAMSHFDALKKQVDAGRLDEMDFLDDLNTVVCAFFCDFLKIHPYANGNGHMARFIAWALFGRYGYWPATWTVHPRLPDPKYTELIRAYRGGKPDELREYMMNDLRRRNGAPVVAQPKPLAAAAPSQIPPKP